MPALHTDPAEQSGFLRHFYHDWQATRLGRFWSRTMAFLAGLGLLPSVLVSLQVKNPRSGRLESTVLASVMHQGQRYIVSMLQGRSQWVENARASGGKAFIKRGTSKPVRLVEIPVEARAAILKAWTRVATSGRRHLPIGPDAPLSAFEAIAANYPVFRVDPAVLQAE